MGTSQPSAAFAEIVDLRKAADRLAFEDWVCCAANLKSIVKTLRLFALQREQAEIDKILDSWPR